MDQPLKPGIKSSEFWVTVIVTILNLFKMFYPDAMIDPNGEGSLAVTGIAAAYVLGRSIIKAVTAKKLNVLNCLLISLLVGVLGTAGCAGSGITKAYNAISAVQSGYNPAGPILVAISHDWPEEKKLKVEAADKAVHDALAASWGALYSWKAHEGSKDAFVQTLNAILAALDHLSDEVGDNQIFKNVVLGIKTVLDFYLQVHPQQAEETRILKEFSISLEQLAESGRLSAPGVPFEVH